MNTPYIWSTVRKPGAYVDLATYLMEHRTIFIGPELTMDVSSVVCMQLLALSQDQAPISIYLNCGGGAIPAALAIMDMIDTIDREVPVHTYCLGECIGGATLVLAAGRKGERRAFTSARISLYQDWYGVESLWGAETQDRSERDRLLDVVYDAVLPRMTKLDQEGKQELRGWLRDLRFISTIDALNLGIIDELCNDSPFDVVRREVAHLAEAVHSHDPAEVLSIEIAYPARLNWSLLQAGIPFVLCFRITQLAGMPRARSVTIAIPHDLDPTELQVTADDCARGHDLSGVLWPLLVNRWQIRHAWQMGTTPVQASLEVRLDDGPTVRFPLEALPPTCWQRLIPSPEYAASWLPIKRCFVEITSAGQSIAVADDTINWQGMRYPPLESTIAALIDPAAPYARPNRLATTPGGQMERLLTVEGEPSRHHTPDVLLRALYHVLCASDVHRHAGMAAAWSPDDEVWPLLASDLQLGVTWRDPVCLACELLEARALRPVVLFANGGRRPLLGVCFGEGVFADQQPVCRDAAAIDQLIAEEGLHLLDVWEALAGATFDDVAGPLARTRLSEGFVAAVDIAATRVWSNNNLKFAVSPLLRPRIGLADWVPAYLELRLQADLRSPEAPTARDGQLDENSLDDPNELFVPITCWVAGSPSSEAQIVLDADGASGWLYQQVVAQPGRVALLAEGGAGKSYLCRRLALSLAEVAGTPGSALAPIFYPLRLLGRDEQLLDALARYVGCSGAEDLISATRARRLILFLDALDESDFSRRAASHEDFARLLEPLNQLPGISVVLTARPALFQGNTGRSLTGYGIAYLLPWNPGAVRMFLEACSRIKRIDFEGGWRRFYERIYGTSGSHNLQDLIRTPLFARMIVVTRRDIEGGEEVRNTLDLYRRYTQTCFERRGQPARIPIDEAHEATAEVAFSMYIHRMKRLTREQIANELSAHIQRRGIERYRAFLDHDVRVHGVLTHDRTDSPEDMPLYRFSHLTIEEYFLAEWLGSELLDNPHPDIVSALFGHAPLSQGVTTFMSQMLDVTDQQELGRKLRRPRERRHVLFSPALASRPVPRFDGDVGFRNLLLIYLAAGGRCNDYDLIEVDLRRADLSCASLRGSNLSGSQLRAARLADADLAGCLLRGADLRGVDLTRANLSGVELTDTDLSEANCDGCNLSGAHAAPDRGPSVCFIRNMATIIFEPPDCHAADLLRERIDQCAHDPEGQAWAAAAREAMQYWPT